MVAGRQRLAVLAAALWWGGLTALGFIAVPLLFASLPTPALAGQAAAKLFTASSWLAIGCGVFLLLASREKGEAPRLDAAGGSLAFVLGGMLLALLLEFAVGPRIVARENLRVWHSVGSAMYVGQWVCALVVLLRVAAGSARSPSPDDRSGAMFR